MSHYLFALKGGWQKVSHLAANKRTRLGLTLILVCTIGIGVMSYSVVFFMLHHILSETYLINRHYQINKSSLKWLNFSRAVLSGAIFIYLLKAQAPFNLLSEDHAQFIFYVATAAFFLSMFYFRSYLTKNTIVDILFFESISICFAMAATAWDLQLHHIVFYHVVLWMFYPCVSVSKTTASLRKYVSNMSVLTVFLLSLILWIRWNDTVGFNNMFRLITFIGYFHIALSFVLSNVNPSWLSVYFDPIKSQSNSPQYD